MQTWFKSPPGDSQRELEKDQARLGDQEAVEGQAELSSLFSLLGMTLTSMASIPRTGYLIYGAQCNMKMPGPFKNNYSEFRDGKCKT